MSKTTQSGYTVKITAFVPCGKDAQSHITAFMKFRQAIVWLSESGYVDIEMHNEFKPRHRSPAPGIGPSDAPPPSAVGEFSGR